MRVSDGEIIACGDNRCVPDVFRPLSYRTALAATHISYPRPSLSYLCHRHIHHRRSIFFNLATTSSFSRNDKCHITSNQTRDVGLIPLSLQQFQTSY